MSSTRPRFVHRSFACLFALVAAVALASCGGGDDDDSQSAQKLSYSLAAKGKAVMITAPEKAESGLAEISVTNDSDADADLQLIRTEGDRTPAEVVKGLSEAIQGKAFPEWLFPAAGIGTLEPGESATVEQVLQPGDYFAFNTEGGPPSPKAAAVTEVTGEESDAEIAEGEGTVEGVEYAFNAETLPSGPVEIAFDNLGAQPHHLIASKFIDDKATAEDVEKFFKTEKGKPPISEKGTKSTAVLEGGEGQLVTLDLEPGRYALYCFITDREGGPPHAFKGMIDEVEVE